HSPRRYSRRLLRLSMRRVLAAPAAIFLELEAVRMRPPILRRRVVPALTGGAGERDDVTHALLRDLRDHAPPPRPPPPPARRPPRRANRRSCSLPMRPPSSIAIVTLSPGITISTPWGNVHTPVTSVVRK